MSRRLTPAIRVLICTLLMQFGAMVATSAQDACPFGTSEPFDGLVKALNEAKSCKVAAAKLNACAWGSSADIQFGNIVTGKCEQEFYTQLSPAGKRNYGDQMQMCAYEYARQDGTLYMSAAALCQVAVAVKFAADPLVGEQPEPRASFDCAKASSPLEKSICSDIQLGHADIILSRVYKEALAYRSDDGKVSERPALILNQRQWLQGIPTKCGLANPASARALSCLRNEFEERFSDLDGCMAGDSMMDCLNTPEDPKAPGSIPGSGPRASFDCEKPTTGLEIVICADAALGQLDIQLDKAYRDAEKSLGPAQHGALIASERQWLRSVAAFCPLGVIGGIPPLGARGCVIETYEHRITLLRSCPGKETSARVPCLNQPALIDTKPQP